MKRRQLIRYAGASLLTATATASTSLWQSYQAQTPSGSVSVQWLGHTCFLFTGNGLRILVNPFQDLGCTARYRLPKVEADVVLISSQLLDEGATSELPGNPKVLFEPGVFRIGGLQFQGISIAHDRNGGRRFGRNVAWLWTQGGVKILHLGGAAAPLKIEEKIAMGQPDVALIPVGGGPKAYNPQEAKQAMLTLKPKMVIPTHYLTEAADRDACDLVSVDEFIALADGVQVRRLDTDKITIKPKDLPQSGSLIRVFSYRNALKPPSS